jgi:hypothetical protein
VYVWAASSSSANLLNGDFACHDGGSGDPTLSGIDGDRTVLDDDVDSDGDGVSDADEVENGTDPNDPDSRPGGLAFAGGGGCRIDPRSGAGTSPLLLALAAVATALLARRRPS